MKIYPNERVSIMEIIRKEYSIPSKSGVADVFARCWVPADGAKAIFQIVHGMAEHGERYEDFANSSAARALPSLLTTMSATAGHQER